MVAVTMIKCKRIYSVVVKALFLVDQPLFWQGNAWVEDIEQAFKFKNEHEAEQFRNDLVCIPEEYLTVWNIAEE